MTPKAHATLTQYLAESITASAGEAIGLIGEDARAVAQGMLDNFFADLAQDSLLSTPSTSPGTLTINGIKAAVSEIKGDPRHIPLPPLLKPPSSFYGEFKWVEPTPASWFGGLDAETALMDAALRRTAFHEAGHAIMAHHYGSRVSSIMISPHAGEIFHSPLPGLRDSFTGLPAEAIIVAAGSAAEARLRGKEPEWFDGSEGDKEQTWEAIKQMNCGAEQIVGDPVGWALTRAHQLLGEPGLWRAVELLADEVMSMPVVGGPATGPASSGIRAVLSEVFDRIENRLAAEGHPPIRRIDFHGVINLTAV